MIKREQLKYQSYPAMSEVLFDLARDPAALVNVVEEAACAEAVATFRQQAAG